MTNTNAKKGISWLTLLGTFFALIICIITSGMIYIVYPQSSRLMRLFLGINETESSLSIPHFVDSNAPTAFQPISTAETIIPTLRAQHNLSPTEIPEPTQQPTPIPETNDEILPASASISGIFGSPQLYTLDCEAQSAVDWARFFGVSISELEFIDRLPHSDDPTQGFVGDINGAMGRLPPDDYGVHAGPVADLLREYGLNAHAVSGWDIQAIKKEVAEGRPVIVWTVNLPFAVETSQYTASNGNTTTVARYEHTWIITGYNASTFTVVDSEWTYNVKTSTLIERWNALGNQAIILISD